MAGTPVKVARMIPVEAVMVSLCRNPSAKKARLVPLSRSAEQVGLVEEILREAPPTIPPGQALRSFTAEIRNVDSANRVIFGQVYNPPWDPVANAEVTREEYDAHVDQHGTFMTAEDIRSLAHRFMQVSRGVDVQHNKVPGAGIPVESFIARAGWAPWDEGAWVMGTHIDDDDIWRRVQLGQTDPNNEEALWGYSVHVLAATEDRMINLLEMTRSAPEPAPVVPPPDLSEDQRRGVLSWLLRALGLSKDETRATSEFRDDTGPTDFAGAWVAEQAEGTISAAHWTLRRVIQNIFESPAVTDKGAAVAKACSSFQAVILDLWTRVQAATATRSAADATRKDPWGLLDALKVEQRAGKKMAADRLEKLKAAIQTLSDLLAEVDDTPKEEETVKAEEMRAIIAEAMKPFDDKLTDLGKRVEAAEQKRAEPAEPAKPEPAKPEKTEAELITEAVRSAIAPVDEKVTKIAERVAALEGTAPAPKSNDDPKTQTRAATNWADTLWGKEN